MAKYKVTYTAYEKGSCMVASEGVIELDTTSSWQAEQTVKAMFSGLEVIIRYTNSAQLHLSKLITLSNSRLACYSIKQLSGALKQ